MSEQSKKPRVSQEARRAEVIDAALIEFGQYGYAGTSTSMIASRAGIRQPYIYALFENKRALFLACHDVLNDRIRETFRENMDPEDSSYERLRKMGLAYLELINDDNRVRCHLHVFAAAGIDDLKEPIRVGFNQLFDDVVEMSGAEPPDVARFFASGMLINAMTALDEPFEMIRNLEVTPEDEL
ncbi:MAG: TetR/AcrR family transcriptional regulator [Solirubrobacterales bacterium]|nr:TetR/AcrR family transcriptional regulator [Solirubrobacterales bacterium]